ncbi:MAG: hypothetical protein WCT16_03175 [Candidatus Buchananbacteria bacterium]
MPVPYISITGFTNRQQAEAMSIVIERAGAETPLPHHLGVGVMTSHKLLRGLPTRYAEVFPKKSDISKIFIPHPLAFNTLHFADYEAYSWDETTRDFEEALFWGEPYMQALQLDMIWPDYEVVSNFKRIYPRISIILQIGAYAFKEVEEQPDKLLERLKLYGSALDYVLLDKSMGQGKLMSVQFLEPFLDKLSEQRPDLGLVVAGGLGPETIGVIESLIKKYPKLSIDAQGRLLDWQMAKSYLEQAIHLFQSVNNSE